MIQRSTSAVLNEVKQADPFFAGRSQKEQTMLVLDRLEAMLAARV